MRPATSQQSAVGSQPSAADSQSAAEPPATSHEPPVPSLLAKPWYWYYVLGLLTLCYVANVVDRSQVLAASLQAIKREFGATDFQLGMLTGLPFALVLLVARHSRSRRGRIGRAGATCWRWSCALWSAHDGAVRHGRQLRDAVRARAWARPSARPAAARRRTRSSPTTFRSSSAERRFRFSRWRCRSARRSAPRSAAGATSISAGAPRSSGRVSRALLALLVRLTVIEPPRGYATTSARRSSSDEGAAGAGGAVVHVAARRRSGT